MEIDANTLAAVVDGFLFPDECPICHAWDGREDDDECRLAAEEFANATFGSDQRHIAFAGGDQRVQVSVLRVAAGLAPHMHAVARTEDRAGRWQIAIHPPSMIVCRGAIHGVAPQW